MSNYAAAIPRPPRTLTNLEQAALLKVTGEHRSGFRDHVLLALALGTGLREHEIAALDVGDILGPEGRVRRRVALRVFKRSSQAPARASSPARRSSSAAWAARSRSTASGTPA